MNELDKQYKELLQNILDNGEWSNNRTGIRTKYINGAMIKVDLRDGFPISTLSKRGYKYVAAELECFIKGLAYDKREFQKRKCHIWDEWCAPSIKAYGHSEEDYKAMKEEWRLGPIYGSQWRCFDGDLNEDKKPIYGTGTDQLKEIIEIAKKDPTSRRLICSAWNPNQSKDMALTPCVFSWQLMLNPDNKMADLIYYQRSCDTALGVPADIESYSMLLILLAAELGYTPRYVSAMMANTHIYENHIEGAKEIISRSSFDLPKIKLTKFTSIYDFEYTDFELDGYQSGEKINFDVAI